MKANFPVLTETLHQAKMANGDRQRETHGHGETWRDMAQILRRLK